MSRKRTKPKIESPFTRKIGALRQEHGLSMNELGKRMGTSGAYISLLESGERNPSRDMIERLVKALYPQGQAELLDDLLILAGFTPIHRKELASPTQENPVQTLIQANPDNFKDFMDNIIALVRMGAYKQAETKIQKGLGRFNRSVVHLQALMAYLELTRKSYDHAILAQQSAIQHYDIANKADKADIRYFDLVFNLGVMHFLKGFDALNAWKSSGKKSDKNLALEQFAHAESQYQKAEEIEQGHIFVLDEMARLYFNLADLTASPSHLEPWEQAITRFQKVMLSPERHRLGDNLLYQSACFLAHTYSKCQRFEDAELTLNLILMNAKSPGFALYVKSCMLSLKYALTPDEIVLSQGLSTLHEALKHSPEFASEAKTDPDLAALRQANTQAFNKVIKNP